MPPPEHDREAVGPDPASGPGEAALLVFDGDCGFCRRAVRWVLAATGSDRGDDVRLRAVPFQECDDPRVPLAACREAVHLVEPDGRVTRGAEACFRAYALAPGKGWVRAVARLPLLRPLSEFVYRRVARNRVAVSRGVRLVSGDDSEPSTYGIGRRAFLSLLGLVFVAAFVSFGAQAAGLIGRGGIAPLAERYDWARVAVDPAVVWRFPTLFWFDQSDAFLALLCGVGALAGAALFLGVAARWALLLAWLGYLSIANVAAPFLNFQWDVLLLEAGFLAFFVAPGGVSPRGRGWRRAVRPSGVLLLRFLLFRLVFTSGVVKLTSGDPSWAGLAALDYHYWTQPLPVTWSWFAAALPDAVHAVLTAAVLGIELVLPFFLFGPRRLRALAVVGIVALQVGIALTGSYGFFNLLTVALCALALDDQTIRSRLPNVVARRVRRPEWVSIGFPRQALRASLAGVLVLLASVAAWSRIDDRAPTADVRRVLNAVWPYHIANGYGLFATMTTRRPELVVEGSRDGRRWQTYEFAFKPGDVDQRPRAAGLHMPRLDWQMWFAALDAERGRPPEPWGVLFVRALLEGRDDVTALLADDPFDGRRPRYVRVWLYDYRRDTRRNDGVWWQRRRVRLYVPPVELRGGEVVVARI